MRQVWARLRSSDDLPGDRGGRGGGLACGARRKLAGRAEMGDWANGFSRPGDSRQPRGVHEHSIVRSRRVFVLFILLRRGRVCSNRTVACADTIAQATTAPECQGTAREQHTASSAYFPWSAFGVVSSRWPTFLSRPAAAFYLLAISSCVLAGAHSAGSLRLVVCTSPLCLCSPDRQSPPPLPPTQLVAAGRPISYTSPCPTT